jgi:Trypsin-like peptidase domain
MHKIPLLLSLSLCCYNSSAQLISRIESVQSLYIEIYRDTVRLGNATGFVIRSKTRNYLVTNYHVVTNKKPTDMTWLNPRVPVSPNRIGIVHNGKKLGEFIVKFENLITPSGDTLYKHSTIGNEMVDVVEVPLVDTSDIAVYPVNYNNTTDSIVVAPLDRVYIPGFPLGYRSSGSLPIWKSAFIASEPDFDQENKPIVWLDDVPFPGMSGSPVYLITKDLLYKNGSSVNIVGAPEVFFMGVFSHGTAVYGALWKGTFLKKIFESLP